MTEPTPTSRREFLTVVAAGTCAAVCGAALPACTVGGTVAGGNIADLAEGTLRGVTGAGVAIGRDADGVYALSSVCTHLNCDMQDQGSIDATNGFVCDCHDSTFTVDGAVTAGPAPVDLDNYAVTIDEDGEMTIDLDDVVSPGTRTAVTA